MFVYVTIQFSYLWWCNGGIFSLHHHQVRSMLNLAMFCEVSHYPLFRLYIPRHHNVVVTCYSVRYINPQSSFYCKTSILVPCLFFGGIYLGSFELTNVLLLHATKQLLKDTFLYQAPIRSYEHIGCFKFSEVPVLVQYERVYVCIDQWYQFGSWLNSYKGKLIQLLEKDTCYSI